MVGTLKKNYYEIIEVPRTASEEEIRKSYKKLALKLHPDKNRKDGIEPADDRFKDLQEAFNTLSDPIKRRKYDMESYAIADQINNLFSQHAHSNNQRYQRQGFGRDTTNARNAMNGAHTNHAWAGFHSNSSHPFSQWSESRMNNSSRGGGRGGYFQQSHRAQQYDHQQQQRSSQPPPPPPKKEEPAKPLVQDPPVVYDVKVTLEELCTGKTRRIKIEREVLRENGVMDMETDWLEIEVQPGWKEGTKITFAQKGDVYPGRIPASIVFLIKEKEHPHFRRDNADLLCNFTISLRDALCGAVTVPCLCEPDGLLVDLGQPIKPGTVHRIPERGLPDRKNEFKRGDLVVTFDVQFPNKITDEVRKAAELLPKDLQC